MSLPPQTTRKSPLPPTRLRTRPYRDVHDPDDLRVIDASVMLMIISASASASATTTII